MGTHFRRAGHLAWHVVLLEIALYVCVARWIARRPDVPTGATAIGYARLAAPMIWLFIFGSVIEVAVLDVLLHRYVPSIRLPVLVLGIWSILWMVGLLASYRMKPHLITDELIHVRNGPRTDIELPLSAITDISTGEHDLDGTVRSVQVEETMQALPKLLVGVSGRTNLQLTTRPGTVVRLPAGLLTPARDLEVGAVGMWVDEPRDTAALLRRRCPAASR